MQSVNIEEKSVNIDEAVSVMGIMMCRHELRIIELEKSNALKDQQILGLEERVKMYSLILSLVTKEIESIKEQDKSMRRSFVSLLSRVDGVIARLDQQSAQQDSPSAAAFVPASLHSQAPDLSSLDNLGDLFVTSVTSVTRPNTPTA